MKYVHPGLHGSLVSFRKRYGNYIGGKFVEPVSGNYFTNTSPVTGQPIAEFPRSDAKDIELALDAAHAAADARGKTSVQERSNVLLAIADRIEARLEMLALTETRQRQTDPRNPECRSAAGGRPFPLLRRLPARAGRHRGGDRPEHRGLPYL